MSDGLIPSLSFHLCSPIQHDLAHTIRGVACLSLHVDMGKCPHDTGWDPGPYIYHFGMEGGGEGDVFASDNFSGLSKCYHRVPRVK
jgi:hypothetical protein